MAVLAAFCAVVEASEVEPSPSPFGLDAATRDQELDLRPEKTCQSPPSYSRIKAELRNEGGLRVFYI
jgi:hypothetical protein